MTRWLIQRQLGIAVMTKNRNVVFSFCLHRIVAQQQQHSVWSPPALPMVIRINTNSWMLVTSFISPVRHKATNQQHQPGGCQVQHEWSQVQHPPGAAPGGDQVPEKEGVENIFTGKKLSWGWCLISSCGWCSGPRLHHRPQHHLLDRPLRQALLIPSRRCHRQRWSSLLCQEERGQQWAVPVTQVHQRGGGVQVGDDQGQGHHHQVHCAGETAGSCLLVTLMLTGRRLFVWTLSSICLTTRSPWPSAPGPPRTTCRCWRGARRRCGPPPVTDEWTPSQNVKK